MTINVSIAGSDDGWISSSGGPSYPNAVNGNGTFFVQAGTTSLTIGQVFSGGNYWVEQGFAKFPYSINTAEMVTAAYFYLNAEGNSGPSVSRSVMFLEYDWGATLTSADFRTDGQLSALDILAEIKGAQNWSSGWSRATNSDNVPGALTLQDRLESTGELRVVICSSRNMSNTTPTTSERNLIRATEQSSQPQLVWTTAPLNLLNRVSGGSVQLSDGTHAVLRTNVVDRDGNNVTMSLVHHNGASETVISSNVVASFNRMQGLQSMTLVADASDNLYVIGNSANSGIRARAYAKGVGHSWTARQALDGSVSSSIYNQFAGAWHSVGGTAGTICTLMGRAAHCTIAVEPQWALLNCDSLLAGSGSLIRGTGSSPGMVLLPSTSEHVNFYNEIGTHMDVAAAPGTSTQGYAVSVTRHTTSICRYFLNSGGTALTTSTAVGTGFDSGVKDGAGKSRVIAVSESQFLEAGSAFPFDLWQIIGTSTTFSSLGFASYSQLEAAVSSLSGIDASFFYGSSAWDLVYSPDESKIWLYYFDTADPNRLMRTSFNLNTNNPDTNEVEVSASVGAVGSTNLAIRVPRGSNQGGGVLVEIANRSSGGTHSIITVLDSFNVAPNAPILSSVDNFDATEDKLLSWTFSDPNVGDTQSAYELQIRVVGAGTDTVATGKITSSTSSRNITGGTLSNGVDYQWRVRTWDPSDVVGAWSAYEFFSTAAGGTVTITDPVADNPADQNVSSYTVSWSVTGAVQDEYRVQMFVEATGEELYDSGWEVSTATSHLVPDIPSDVEVRFQVTVRDNLVDSQPGTRLYTTSYTTPPQPIVTVSSGPGYIEISVSNPEPDGDVVQVIRNDIYRRESDDVSGSYVLIGSAELDGTYRDYTARSRVQYSYVVRGVGP